MRRVQYILWEYFFLQICALRLALNALGREENMQAIRLREILVVLGLKHWIVNRVANRDHDYLPTTRDGQEIEILSTGEQNTLTITSPMDVSGLQESCLQVQICSLLARLLKLLQDLQTFTDGAPGPFAPNKISLKKNENRSERPHMSASSFSGVARMWVVSI